MKTFIPQNILEWREKNRHLLCESPTKSLAEISESLAKLKEKVENLARTNYEN
jgi:hypothetical protein